MSPQQSSPEGVRKFVCPEVVFGADSRHYASRCLRNLGANRVFVASDAGVAAAGWTGEIVEALAADGLHPCLFNRITSNPRDHEIMAGADLYRSLGCDTILAVGGGSVIDCAKGVGIIVSNGGHILDYRGVDRIASPLPPVACIPTTAGSSADVSQFATVRHLAERSTTVIISGALVPDVALVDPVTVATMDPLLTAGTGFDALAHAIEAFVSTGSSAMTDIHALQAVVLLRTHLLDSIEHPDDTAARSGVMLGSLEAGLAFSNASLGAVHAMAHGVGGLLDLPHGQCCAMLLPHVVAYNYDAVPERFRVLAESLGLDLRGMASPEIRNALIAEIARLRIATGIRATLGGSGLERADIPALARRAMEDPCIVTNPRRPVQQDVEVIYQEAM
ncbi:MAG: iron-containing alcohol dehydrogenase [Tepidisphaerales bacterium]